MSRYQMHYSHNRVIVLIPCYNEAACIGEAIHSVRSQTHGDFLCLIRDNSSTDETLKCINQAIQNDSRFTVIVSQRNEGASANWWKLFSVCDAPYILFLGAHDRLAPTFLEETLSVLEANQDLVSCYTLAGRISETGNLTSISNGGDFVFDIRNSLLRYFVGCLFMSAECSAIHGLFRRSAWQGLTRLPVYHSPDRYVLGYMHLAGRFTRLEKPLYERRYFLSRSSSSMERVTGQKKSRDVRPCLFPLVFDQTVLLIKKNKVSLLGLVLAPLFFVLLMAKYRRYLAPAF